MGEADQQLDTPDYGSRSAIEYASHIKALANELVLKTSTDNKLAHEGFMFARDIAKKSK